MNTMLAEAEQDYEAGKFQTAAKKCRTILEGDPENSLAHQVLAQCLSRLGQCEEAAEECNRALELNPKLAIPHAVLGSIYFRQQRLGESEAALRRAIELDSSLKEPYICLGATLAKQERLQEAVTVLQKALELNPHSGVAHYNLSIAYAQQKRDSDAVREAFCAFKLDPSVRTGRIVVLGVLRRLAEHRVGFSLLVIALLLLPFLFPSPITLLLFVLVIAYSMLGIMSDLRSAHRTRGVVRLLLIVTLVGLYVYHMIFG